MTLPTRLFWMLLFALFTLSSACTTVPKDPVDPVAHWLEPGEVAQLRVAARLMHGHDMTEPSYDAPEGYQPIPTYEGTLVLTESRLLFVSPVSAGEASTLSIPYTAITRARPSQTPLLHYLVVWDSENHPDSFVVDHLSVQELHRRFGAAFMKSMRHKLGK